MFLDKKTFFSLIGVSVFGGCWTQAWSLIADLSCLYHIWGVSDTYVNNQKYNVLDRKFLTLSLLPCPPKSLWSLFCAFSFYRVWCRVVKSNPWVTTAEVSVGTPDTARSCISRRLRRSRVPRLEMCLGSTLKASQMWLWRSATVTGHSVSPKMLLFTLPFWVSGHLWQCCGGAGLGSCRWALLLPTNGKRVWRGSWKS